jgi:hypothetical protein
VFTGADTEAKRYRPVRDAKEAKECALKSATGIDQEVGDHTS